MTAHDSKVIRITVFLNMFCKSQDIGCDSIYRKHVWSIFFPPLLTNDIFPRFTIFPPSFPAKQILGIKGIFHFFCYLVVTFLFSLGENIT